MFLRDSQKASVAGAKGIMGTVAGEGRVVDRGHFTHGLMEHAGTLDFIVNVQEF